MWAHDIETDSYAERLEGIESMLPSPLSVDPRCGEEQT